MGKHVKVSLHSFNLSHELQAAIAFLSALGAVLTTVLHDTSGFLPGSWSAAVTSILTVIAAVNGFLAKVEPLTRTAVGDRSDLHAL